MVEKQLDRNEKIKADKEFLDYNKLDKIIIGIVGGDGIGPAITAEGHRVLEFLLQDKVESGKVEFRVIEGLTIERRAAEMKAIPRRCIGRNQKCMSSSKGQLPHRAAGTNGLTLKVQMWQCAKNWICLPTSVL